MGTESPAGRLSVALNAEIDVLTSLFPGLSFRFCRVMGRRLSHLAGDTSAPRYDELRLTVGTGLLMMVSGHWREREDALRNYSRELALRIGDRG